MIKKIAWDTFKNTGDINSFLEFKQIETLENNMLNNTQDNQENKDILNINMQKNEAENKARNV